MSISTLLAAFFFFGINRRTWSSKQIHI